MRAGLSYEGEGRATRKLFERRMKCQNRYCIAITKKIGRRREESATKDVQKQTEGLTELRSKVDQGRWVTWWGGLGQGEEKGRDFDG